MTIQFIDKQPPIFRLMINKHIYFWSGKSLWKEDAIVPLPAKVKGSTLGWNIENSFISYNQLREKYLSNK